MKKFKIFLIAACIMLLTVGCSKEEELFQANKNDKRAKLKNYEQINEHYVYEEEGYTAETDIPIYKNVEDIVEMSDLIISGKIIDIEKKIGQDVMPGPMEYWQEFTIEINNVYKGNYDDSTFKFGISSYYIKFLESKLSGQLELRDGEEYLFLLTESKYSTVSTTAQSIYSLNSDLPIEISGIKITGDEVLERLK